MRAVLKGTTQEFIQGGITPSGLATQVRRGIIKGFDPTTYRATVQLLGSLSVWLEGVPVAKHLGSNLLSSGARCGVLFFDESNPSDACLAFVYDGAPGPWITSGLVVDGAITASDCLSNVAGGVATIDAAGDLNPPNHVRAAGRFYPGGQGSRYLYDAGPTPGLAVAGGPFSTTGYIYPGTGSALQTVGYLYHNASYGVIVAGSHLFATRRFYPGQDEAIQNTRYIYDTGSAVRVVGRFDTSSDIYCGDAIYPGGQTTNYFHGSTTGIGLKTNTPGGLFHIKGAAASGAPTWDATDYLIIEGAQFANMAILTNASNGQGSIMFADSGSRYAGFVQYTHADDIMRFGTASAEKMRLNTSGDLYIDGTYNTFSPVPPKENMSPEDYLAWAMEDASKPPKPYSGIPKDSAEMERYRKDISKIAIGVAKYVDHLRTVVVALDARLTQAGW